MEQPGGRRPGMCDNAAVASSSVVGLLLSPARSPAAAAAVPSGANKAAVLHQPCAGDGHRGVPPSQQQQQQQQHLVQQHHQYPVALGPPPLIRTSLVHTAGSLLTASPQLMLSTVAPTSTQESPIPRYQTHGGGSALQLGAATTPPAAPSAAAAAAAVGPAIMAGSNISALGMVSPFGILPHERVVPLHQAPHHHHHRHQNRKLSNCQPQQQQQSSKTLMETGGAQLLASSVANPQRFYDEPLGNKMKEFDGVQQSHHRLKMLNGINSDKGQPVAVSGGYSPQPYESRYQPRTVAQQVGYLSVITRTAVTTANSAVMDDVTANNNYYQAQASSLHSKAPDHHDRQYYHFDSTISASQTPQQQVDTMLLMGNPVQRGDPMHIVKNLQSMQTDMDCYGVKKMIEQQPRLLTIDNCKSVGPTALLNNSKCSIENQHQNIHQLSKSTVTDPSLSYNSQYFSRRQPPPAHLHQHHNQSHIQQHLASGNGKMLPTPTSLTVVAANGSNYFDQRHHRWNLDQQKPPTISTQSCFSGNIPTGMFHQPSLPPQQQYNNTVSTFNIQPPPASINQHQQMSESTHHNNFIVSSGSPTYYNLTTTMVSPTITSVTTTSPPIAYNRHHQNNQQYSNNFHNFANNVQGENFAVNDDNRLLALPHVVPSIEQELDHLCEDSVSEASVIVKPSNLVTMKASFIDSYIKFLNGDRNAAGVETEDECFEKPKKLQRPMISSPPKLISKPYIPLSKPKVPVSISETPSSRNGSCESVKNIVTTTDYDPRYFPLAKTSASSTVLSDGSNSDHNWLSADDDHDNWWTSPSKASSIPTASVIKNKQEKNKNSAVKKKQSNSVTTTKKQKTQNEKQPRRQSSHRLAKEKTQKLLTRQKSDEDVDSDTDSDVDPAWIPNNDDNDITKSSNSISGRRHFNHKKFSKESCSNSDHSPSTSSLINNNNQTDDLSVTMPFKSGSFVALKSQFVGKDCKNPKQLWRVDGKSLLQKFQQVSRNTFRSATTYTGWGPSHYGMYCQVAVKFLTPQDDVNNVQNKILNTEVIVKLIGDVDDDISDDDESLPHVDCSSKQKEDSFGSKSSDYVDDSMKNLRQNFDVYIQTLTSQALDSNFIDEIYRENDEYFLSNMHAVELVTQSCIKTMESIISQDAIIDFSKVENVCTLATRYPKLEMLALDEAAVRNIQLLCISCGRLGFVGKRKLKFIEISFSGPSYHPKLLTEVDINEAVSKTNPTKRVHCCYSTECTDKLEIMHSLKHLKYRVYKECCERINTENNICYDSSQETTSVLNRLLADEQWISKLFQMASKTWSRAKTFISNKQSNC